MCLSATRYQQQALLPHLSPSVAGGQRLEDRGGCKGQLVGGVDGSMPPRLVESQGSQGAATCSHRICEPPWLRGMILAMTVGGARIGRRVATALLLVLHTAACTRGQQQPQRPGAEPGPRRAVSWQRVEPGGATRCARGGRYAFWARSADPSRLVVFFQGGGGCFDERSCAVGSTWFDDSVTDADDPNHAGGMLAMADPRNPFQDWSWVFIPSCSGDVHLGDRRVRYGSVTVQQRTRRSPRWTSQLQEGMKTQLQSWNGLR